MPPAAGTVRPSRALRLLAPLVLLLPLLACTALSATSDPPGLPPLGPFPPSAPPAPSDIRAVDVPPYRGHDGWPVSSPSAEAVDPAPIAALLARIGKGDYVGIDAVVLARHGRLIADAYFGSFTPDRLHQTRSAFKSVTGLLTGIAVADGLLDPAEPVAPLVARYYTPAGIDPRKRQIRVRHLLEMRSGLDCAEMPGDRRQREARSNRAPDKVAADFGLPMWKSPGIDWHYCSANTFLLGIALESALVRADKGGLKAYLDDRLMRPLDIAHYTIGRTPKGHLPMHGGERLRPRDLAKFGQLLVDGGRWKGRQVVPAAWVTEILSPGIETGWRWSDLVAPGPVWQRPSRYRHQWFQTEMPIGGETLQVVHSWGNGGQFVFAVPARDLVFTVTASNYGARRIAAQKQAFHMLRWFILPAVSEPSAVRRAAQ